MLKQSRVCNQQIIIVLTVDEVTARKRKVLVDLKGIPVEGKLNQIVIFDRPRR
jgi:hypothetical protein